MKPADRDAYIKDCETQIAQIEQSLLPLELGDMKLGSRIGDGPWIDNTAEWIEIHKRNIATYRSIIAALKRDVTS